MSSFCSFLFSSKSFAGQFWFVQRTFYFNICLTSTANKTSASTSQSFRFHALRSIHRVNNHSLSPMDSQSMPYNLLRLLLLSYFIIGFSAALKCKCTQDVGRLKCVDGVCESNSSTAACLMLDHEVTGVHFVCSESDLEVGKCIQKKTKTNAVVDICPCRSEDFCNYIKWPKGIVDEATTAVDARLQHDQPRDSMPESNYQSPKTNDISAAFRAQSLNPLSLLFSSILNFVILKL